MDVNNYSALSRYVQKNNWEQGISVFFDEMKAEVSSQFSMMLRNRFTNSKIFLDLDKKRALIIDSELGINTDYLFKNTNYVFYLNNSLDKALISKLRNHEKGNKLKCCVAEFINGIPVKDSSFDLVIIYNYNESFNIEKLKHKNNEKIFNELYRILSPNGSLLIIYRRRILKFWREKIEKYVLKKFLNKNYEVLLYAGNFENPEEVVSRKVLKKYGNEFLNFTWKAKRFLRCLLLNHRGYLQYGIVAHKGGGYSTLQKIIDSISQKQKTKYYLEKILFQSSTIIFLNSKDKNKLGLILRIPYDDDSSKRCRVNYDSLKYIQKNIDLKGIVIPKPIACGNVDGIEFFAEKKIDGCGYDYKCQGYNEIIYECLRLSIEIYHKSKISIDKYRLEYRSRIDKLFNCFNTKYSSTKKNEIDRLYSYLTQFLKTKNLMGCCCHGDYKAENILVNKNNVPIGIIDWDLFDVYGLPLIDLLHLLCRRAAVYKRINAIDYIKGKLLKKEFGNFEWKCIEYYLEATGNCLQAVYPTLIFYWLHHINCRIGFNIIKKNYSWYKRHVEDELEIALHSIDRE